MEKLNFPEYRFRIKESGISYTIFDVVRKKFVALTPEEWVRQHVIHHFTETLEYPASLISVEKTIKTSGRSDRFDLIVYNRNHEPAMIVECKAPNIILSASVVEQVSRYNIFSKAGWVYITNGLQHYLYRIDFKTKKTKSSDNFPAFTEL